MLQRRPATSRAQNRRAASTGRAVPATSASTTKQTSFREKPVALVGRDHNLIDAGVQSVNAFLPNKILGPLFAQLDDSAALPAAVRAQSDHEPVKSLSLRYGVRGHVEVDDLKPMATATRGDVTIVPYDAALQSHRG
jgi:hypothetical protein